MGKNEKKLTLAETHSELAAQWHPTKNGNLTPDMVTCGSDKKVWWMFLYDDPETGKHFNFEWESTIAHRVNGIGCPFLSGRAVWPGFNDLTTKQPELAKEWHPTKNGNLTPETVSQNSNKKVWWNLPYDEPETGKHFNFEWEAVINSRTNGLDCPFLSGRAVWPGYNDLVTKHPALAAEWHPTRNGNLTPDMFTSCSNKKVWWMFPYNDTETGKRFDFEWEATIISRTNGIGCPYISGHAVWPGYNDLATKSPMLAKEWHPTKNGELTPENVTCGSSKIVWWLLPYDDPEDGKHFDFEWKARIADRINGQSCPFIPGKAVWPGYNDLATKRPDIAAEWHPEKNGNLTPEMVTCGSNQKVWWRLLYDDPETEKQFDFEWEANINARTSGVGCPFLSGHAVWTGFNDLATKQPKLVSEWHPIKNGDLTPDKVTCGSPQKVWWIFPYDDPNTGKHFDFEWRARVYERVDGTGCPFLSGTAVWLGFNDLASRIPELATQWHPTKNGNITPAQVTYGSRQKAWWLLPYDDPGTGKHFDFEWEATIISRANGIGCPYISGNAVWPGFNDLATKQPELAKEWHPVKNGDLTPDKVAQNSNKKVWWFLPYDDAETGKHFDFEWEAEIKSRLKGLDCPFLSGHAVWLGYNDLATKRPDIAAEWHPEKNGNLTPEMVTCYSGQKVWWHLLYDDPETEKHFDFVWEAYIYDRTSGTGCPVLSGAAVWPGFNDLASQYPKLAAEWHSVKNRSKTPDKTYVKTCKKAWWKCSQCGHEWRSSVYKRVCIDEICPECKKRLPKYY